MVLTAIFYHLIATAKKAWDRFQTWRYEEALAKLEEAGNQPGRMLDNDERAVRSKIGDMIAMLNLDAEDEVIFLDSIMSQARFYSKLRRISLQEAVKIIFGEYGAILGGLHRVAPIYVATKKAGLLYKDPGKCSLFFAAMQSSFYVSAITTLPVRCRKCGRDEVECSSGGVEVPLVDCEEFVMAHMVRLLESIPAMYKDDGPLKDRRIKPIAVETALGLISSSEKGAGSEFELALSCVYQASDFDIQPHHLNQFVSKFGFQYLFKLLNFIESGHCTVEAMDVILTVPQFFTDHSVVELEEIMETRVRKPHLSILKIAYPERGRASA